MNDDPDHPSSALPAILGALRMSDFAERLAKRNAAFEPLRVRWPGMFGVIDIPGGYSGDALEHLASKTVDVDGRIIDAYVRIRIATDSPCRPPQPTLWNKIFGTRPVPRILEDLIDLQRRFEAMRLVADASADDASIILNIVTSSEARSPGSQ